MAGPEADIHRCTVGEHVLEPGIFSPKTHKSKFTKPELPRRFNTGDTYYVLKLPGEGHSGIKSGSSES
jgi:hypothetical protein